MMGSSLSKPQKDLLNEIAEAGVLYVRRNSRYDRTVESLRRRGLVEVVEPDYSRLGMNGWAIVACTGIAAGFCPVCGECSCPGADSRTLGQTVDLDDPLCPLHRHDSRHGELKCWPPNRHG